ncbi:SRPBCC family protein [Streptomyces sp. CO7]
MSVIEESIEVRVPVHTAYNQWTQFETFPEFMSGVERIEQRTDTLTHWVTKVDGVKREFDAEITEQIPDECVSWTTVDGDTKQEGRVTFQPVAPGATRVNLHMRLQPEGAAEKIGDKLGFVGRNAKADLARFKTFIEERGTETGEWRGTVL